ncbi:Probable peptide chain release factor C12orf65 homolog, mitochondrial [Seminavis robusta]|uniref:Probable peptide chain release factor C12orf65 homolog, mitochondrial n=1 Tax=Seminavis robusta TaxID=568900 RepID=A0A9N8DMY8_9STRA|nr:Probable peptide chain release factor C12orf65 homolog, mitochondrial [Seminavis robusta]|eukprot:Sro173_g076250.1 Probable peptide chain release factor C12orf65 homolog, mitochondrial (432) ;mRNA; f:30438-31733
MENLYTEWSLEQDKLLWEHRKDPIVELAALLGRGLRGVQARLDKLHNVNSPAYERLFANNAKQQSTNDDTPNDGTSSSTTTSKKLIPFSELARRIQWDYSLDANDFFILHYDRVDDAIVESPWNAPNDSIEGSATSLIDALPEHRIVAVKYKEQVVWDRPRKLDKVFGTPGIQDIVENYDEWKRQHNANRVWLRQRQEQFSTLLQRMMGLQQFTKFRSMSLELKQQVEQDATVSSKMLVEDYIQECLVIFQQLRQDPAASQEPSLIPPTDIMALECLSEFMALNPHPELRQLVLHEIDLALRQLEYGGGTTNTNSRQSIIELPPLDENDIAETFVRGTGPGGQKINKTNNKVVLLHQPTQLRVECQETRSLQQNRKIARKRLQLKLDEFYNGRQSRTSIKAQKASSKKAKAKAKSKARNRKRKQQKKEEGE